MPLNCSRFIMNTQKSSISFFLLIHLLKKKILYFSYYLLLKIQSLIILNSIHSTPSKRSKLDSAFNKQTLNSNRNLISSLSYNDLISFPFSLLIAQSLPIRNVSVAFLVRYCEVRNQMFCPSSPISPQDLPPAYQFAACQRLKEEHDKSFETDDEKVDDFSEIVADEVFFLEDISDGSGLEIDTKSEDKNEDWDDKKPCSSMIASCISFWLFFLYKTIAFSLGSLLINTFCSACNSFRGIRTNTTLGVGVIKGSN